MATRGMSGVAVGLGAVGSFLVYAGIKGTPPLDELRNLLSGSAPEPLSRESLFKPIISAPGTSGSVAGGSSNSSLLNAAAKYLGRPYRWGGTFSGGSGGDCSGLPYRAANDIGIPVPRHTTATWPFSKFARRVSSPSPGDLVVWPGAHMGIHSGPGQMLHAPRTGDVVKYSSYTPTRNGRPAVYLRIVGASLTAGEEKLAEKGLL